MRVPTLALCTLAAVASWDLTHQASAAQAPKAVAPQPTASNFVVPAETTAPTTVEAIAPPETLVAQQFSDSSTPPSDSAQYYQQYQPAVVVPTAPVDPNRPATFPVPAATTTPRPNAIAPKPQVAATPSRTTPPPTTNNDLVVTATDVQIVGANEELQQVIRNVIRTRPGGNTSQSQLQADVTRILSTGLFANANVSSRSNPSGLDVTYQVTPVVVRSLQLSGAKVLTPAIAQELFAAQLGAPASPAALDQAGRNVNEWYKKNGYSLARVIAIEPSQNGVVTLEVAEGTVGKINFLFVNNQGETVDEEGKTIRGRTQESFLRREIQLQAGQAFREDIVRQDLQRLY
ncbi:MAG TPA: POTRA domain-containing protein, partial [Candidatus Obscuribacterales bacterium]